MKHNYSNSFQDYLNKVYNPAQDWACTKEGQALMSQTNIEESNFDAVLCAVYGIYINGVLVYVGEAVKPFRRAIVHLFNMKRYTTEWGMTKQELENAKIEWKIIEREIRDKDDRESKELYYIHSLEPILQESEGGNDHCVRSIVERRKRMKTCFSNQGIKN